ncbi:DUF72 domain-containing protein [bacterium]|nr:DUF72 domain-containing protein [bacterium]
MNDSKIFIGPAGWHYDDWRGVVYPAVKSKNFSELSFLTRYVNTVEINATFYHIPRPEQVQAWVRQSAAHPDFLFTVKAWQGFTHEPTAPAADRLDAFKRVLDVLQTSGRLGAVLIQYPWRFKRSAENWQRVQELALQLGGYGPMVEFRHQSWDEPSLRAALTDNRIGWVNVDQPVIGASIAPGDHVTASTGYARLHGRNYQNWFNDQAGRDQRYDYLYQQAELAEWAERIRSIARHTEKTFVIFNNHFRGQAAVNSLQLTAAVLNKKVAVPDSLLLHYPGLQEIADRSGSTAPLSLFD